MTFDGLILAAGADVAIEVLGHDKVWYFELCGLWISAELFVS